jgi:hypothetical protein
VNYPVFEAEDSECAHSKYTEYGCHSIGYYDSGESCDWCGDTPATPEAASIVHTPNDGALTLGDTPDGRVIVRLRSAMAAETEITKEDLPVIPDQMVPLGTLPGVDFSTGTPVCVDREAHRDYDTVIFPAVQLDLPGITAARKLLDDAERDILAYRFRLFDADDDWTGWDIDIHACRQWLGSFPLGTGFDPDDLAGNDWLEVSRRLDQLNRFPGYGELRALLALLRSDKTPAAEADCRSCSRGEDGGGDPCDCPAACGARYCQHPATKEN